METVVKYFIFRNSTIEMLFNKLNVQFSGYEDISYIDETADRYIWFYVLPYIPDNTILVEKIRQYTALLDLALKTIDKRKMLLLFTISNIYHINYQSSDTNIEEAVRDYNTKIYLLAKNNNIKIIDIDKFYRQFSVDAIIDWKYYFISQMPVNPKLVSEFSSWFSAQLNLIDMQRKKCLVLDLDNTLWSGILGEDGIEGIRMGEDYPGSAFRFFQTVLLELKRHGVILTVCSKNNEDDVFQVWEKHHDMLLRRSDFAAIRINWNNKADNILDIARELNIGLDSMVFVDDNPAERELVKQALPDVCVPDFPQKPYLLPVFAKQLTEKYFTVYQLTQEDIVKTREYQERGEREKYREQFSNMDDYLHSLEMELSLERLTKTNRARFAQMTQKTNQFNLTTRRYSETEIQQFADNGDWVYGLRVKDRFGDNGITGLIIIKIEKDAANIDTFLLSCRILGKGIENAFLTSMLMKLQAIGIRQVFASYIKTAKNGQVEDFYNGQNFSVLHLSDTRKDYCLVIEGLLFKQTDIYKVDKDA